MTAARQENGGHLRSAPAAIDTESSPGKATRTRASKTALQVTLEALKAAGLSVDKVCVNGGKVEIHCGQIAEKPTAKKDGGLKEW